MEHAPRPYWFPAKRYGWGWGVPSSWQGWVVLVVWLGLFVANAAMLAHRSAVLFFAVAALLSGALIAVCYAKGEPPRWRWGGE